MIRYGCLSLLVLGIVGGGVALAQPAEGDIIVCCGSGNLADGATMSVNPSTGVSTTIAPPGATTSYFHNWVRMAENNTDMVVILAEIFSYNGRVARLGPGGALTTIAVTPAGNVNAFDLDGDGQWLLAGGKPRNFWSLPTSGGPVTTLITQTVTPVFNAMAIDRDPGPLSSPYVIGAFDPNGIAAGLFGVDRKGIRSTIAWGADLKWVAGVDLDPGSGDYVVVTGSGLFRVTRSGGISTLGSGTFNAIRMAPDGTIWTAGGNRITRYSSKGQVLSSRVCGVPAGYSIMGLEIYGSRRLVCRGTGKPGSTVSVTLKSLKRFDGNKSYQLACSLARRPGVVFPGGERLHLDVTDGLFLASARNLLPWMFVNFAGRTDAWGGAQASIRIPAGIPSNLGITVFVAGVIHDAKAGVTTATNTHWFELG